MNKLQLYYFFQLVPVFALSLLGLTLIALLTQSLSQLDLLFERGQSAATFIGISLLAMPQVMTVVMPVALFAAVAWAYGRLHQDNEIIVAYGSGWSLWSVGEPAFRLAAVACLFTLAVNLFVQPVALREMRERLFAIRADFASTLLREGEFRSTVPGLMVYARKIERNGTLSGLLIADTKSGVTPVLFVAQRGTIAKLATGPVIVLQEGSVQRKLVNGQVDIVGFSNYVFELKGFADENAELFYKPSDRFLPQLLAPDLTYYWDRDHVGDLLAEAHRRLSAPIICFTAVALALLAVLGGSYSRQGYGMRMAWTFVGLIVVLLSVTGLMPTIASQPALSFLLYLIPLLVLFFATKGMRVAVPRLALGTHAVPVGRKHNKAISDAV
jgi:lipopolysaccharide export system permease protein